MDEETKELQARNSELVQILFDIVAAREKGELDKLRWDRIKTVILLSGRVTSEQYDVWTK